MFSSWPRWFSHSGLRARCCLARARVRGRPGQADPTLPVSVTRGACELLVDVDVVAEVGDRLSGRRPRGGGVRLLWDCANCLTGHPSYCATFFPRNMTGFGLDGSTPVRDAVPFLVGASQKVTASPVRRMCRRGSSPSQSRYAQVDFRHKRSASTTAWANAWGSSCGTL
jgi:hypothetical protein